VLAACLAAACPVSLHAAEARYEVPWVKIFPENPADMESGQCMLELYSYWTTYKKDDKDLAALGALFRVDIGRGWEVRAFGDLLSWQGPDVGFGDVAVGVKWNFLKGKFSAAAALDVEFPSGAKEFREPGPEPTLSLMLSRGFGDFVPTLTLSSTYVSTEGRKDDYFNYQVSLGFDYTLTEVHSIGVFATGYAPAGSTDHSSRLSAGAAYTYSFTSRNSSSVTLTKGFSGRGTDWSVGVSYDYSFNLYSLLKTKRPPGGAHID
jgi:hypothetical protein